MFEIKKKVCVCIINPKSADSKYLPNGYLCPRPTLYALTLISQPAFLGTTFWKKNFSIRTKIASNCFNFNWLPYS